MKFPIVVLVMLLTTQFGQAAEVTRPDVLVRLTRVAPSQRLAETSRLQIPYGQSNDALGFRPAGPESPPVGPHTFAFDSQGNYLIADPLHHRTVRVGMHAGTPLVHPAEALPRPVSGETPVQVRKCSAEAGLLTVHSTGRQIQLETGGPLASIRLIGVNHQGDIFLVAEKFRNEPGLAVDREVLVLDQAGALKARLPVLEKPAVHPDRDFRLAPDGSLHRMVPGTRGVTLIRWEVRP